MKKFNLILPLMIFLMLVLGCFSEKKEVEIVSGRLKLVESKYMGSAGGHGFGRGWITYKRQFYFNDKKWSPENFDMMKDIFLCEPSPNPSVEAIKCRGSYIQGDIRETVYVLRTREEKPLLERVMDARSNDTNGKNDGEWFGDGKWLIFYDNLYNVETGARTLIRPLPIYPDSFHFRTVSPDLKTIVYENIGCSDERGNDWKKVSTNETFFKACEKSEEYEKNKIKLVWLFDADTGATEYLELPREKYPDLFNTANASASSLFQKNLVWQKDKNGRDRLVYPN